jgi:hypothetical protein
VKAELTTFPVGSADGLPVLHLDCDGAPWSTDDADAAVQRMAGARGIWGVWIDNPETWESQDLDVWIAEQPCVIALRELGSTDWPAADLNTVLDVSAALEHATDVDRLADFVAGCAAGSIPIIADAVARVGPLQRAPVPAALDLLADFTGMHGEGYLYAPADHQHWPLVLRAISQCGSQWSLRKA